MTKAVKYIIFPLIIWVYIFGSSGFIVHNCYMSDSFFVQNSIFSAWDSFMFSDCSYAGSQESSDEGSQYGEGFPMIATAQGQCSDYVYTLDGYQYQNQSNENIDEVSSLTIADLSADITGLLASDLRHHVTDSFSQLNRLRCSIDKLCVYLN